MKQDLGIMKQEMKIQKLGMKIMKQNERESDTIYWVLSHEFQRERSWIEMTRNDMKRTCDSKTINDMTYERFLPKETIIHFSLLKINNKLYALKMIDKEMD